MKKILVIIVVILIFRLETNAEFAISSHLHTTHKNHFTIKVQYTQTSKDDTLVLYRSGKGRFAIDIAYGNFKSYKASRKPGGWFTFNVNEDTEHSYILIASLKTKLERAKISPDGYKSDIKNVFIPYYLAETGDNIIIKIKALKDIIASDRDFTLAFSGRGALKYQLQYDTDLAGRFINNPSYDYIDSNLIYNPNNYINQKIDSGLAIINRKKSALSTEDYNILTDYVINNIDGKQGEARMLLFQVSKKKLLFDSLKKLNLLKLYDNLYAARKRAIPLKILLLSRDYTQAELLRQEFRSYLKNDQSYKDSLYSILKNNYRGEVLDRMITLYFIRYGAWLHHYNEFLNDALTVVKSKEYIKELNQLKKKMTGRLAYNFNLQDSSGKRVRLSDFKGKIVFIDFWYTGCGGCASFYQYELSKAEESLSKDTDVVFITVSIDKNKRSWFNSVKSGKYTSTSVINLFTDGKGYNTDVIKYYQVASFPQPMIIGKDQRIFSMGPDLRSEAGIKKTLNEVNSH